MVSCGPDFFFCFLVVPIPLALLASPGWHDEDIVIRVLTWPFTSATSFTEREPACRANVVALVELVRLWMVWRPDVAPGARRNAAGVARPGRQVPLVEPAMRLRPRLSAASRTWRMSTLAAEVFAFMESVCRGRLPGSFSALVTGRVLASVAEDPTTLREAATSMKFACLHVSDEDGVKGGPWQGLFAPAAVVRLLHEFAVRL